MKLIDQLLADTSITSERRVFLTRQRELCLHPGKQVVVQTEGARPLSPAGAADCGPRAIQIVLSNMGKQVSLESLTRNAGTGPRGTTMAGLEKAVKAAGLKCEPVQMDLNALKQMPGMGIAWVDGDHYVAVLSVSGDEARIHDPNHTDEDVIPTETLLRRSGGIVLMISRQ